MPNITPPPKIGFQLGEFFVPSDFDEMKAAEIAEMFYSDENELYAQGSATDSDGP